MELRRCDQKFQKKNSFRYEKVRVGSVDETLKLCFIRPISQCVAKTKVLILAFLRKHRKVNELVVEDRFSIKPFSHKRLKLKYVTLVFQVYHRFRRMRE